jgi:hypothetical protein
MPKLKPGTFLWAPPPAAADAALEELCKARHKRQTSGKGNLQMIKKLRILY